MKELVVTLYHCYDCRRSFAWCLVESEARWPGEILNTGKPTYCPCCGAFDCIHPGAHQKTITIQFSEEK